MFSYMAFDWSPVYHQPIRFQVWKSLLTDSDFDTDISFRPQVNCGAIWGRFSIKALPYQNKDSHYIDEAVVSSGYLYSGDWFTSKTWLYWLGTRK